MATSEVGPPVASDGVGGASGGAPKRASLIALKAGASVILIAWALRNADLGEILAAIGSADPVNLSPALAMLFVGVALAVYRWRLLLRTQGIQLSMAYLGRSYLVSLFLSTCLPSTVGGDAMRAYDTWKDGADKVTAVTVLMVDRLLGLIGLLVFVLGGLLFADRLVAEVPLVFVAASGLCVLTLVAVWLLTRPYARLPVWLWESRFGVVRQIAGLASRTRQAYLVFHSERSALAAAFVLSLALQFVGVLHFVFVSEALGLAIPWTSFLVIVPVADFAMMLPISINGIGVRENVFAFFLGLFGVGLSAAVGFAWLSFGLLLVRALVGGAVWLARRR